MKEAKKLLEETDKKIIEISQMVGYENEKHFMKLFKSICGVSPSDCATEAGIPGCGLQLRLQ
jgi:two-component system, response regulator YesN